MTESGIDRKLGPLEWPKLCCPLGSRDVRPRGDELGAFNERYPRQMHMVEGKR